MEQLAEVPKIRTMYNLAKELSQSPVPVIQDVAILVLALVHNLEINVDPYYILEQSSEDFGRIVKYE